MKGRRHLFRADLAVPGTVLGQGDVHPDSALGGPLYQAQDATGLVQGGRVAPPSAGVTLPEGSWDSSVQDLSLAVDFTCCLDPPLRPPVRPPTPPPPHWKIASASPSPGSPSLGH